MGCGGSKQDVASGNTVRRRRLLSRKKPDTGADASNEPVPPPAASVADVKDITVNMDGSAAAAAPEGEGEGKLVSRESPDRYFSSRKDDESVDAAALQGEYYSPRYAPHGEDAGPKEPVAALVGGEGTTDGSGVPAGTPMAEAGSGKSGGFAAVEQALAGGGEYGEALLNEKLNNRASVELKAPILVEETKLEVTIVEKRNLGVGEIVSGAPNNSIMTG